MIEIAKSEIEKLIEDVVLNNEIDTIFVGDVETLIDRLFSIYFKIANDDESEIIKSKYPDLL